jgi:hypothetical protein
MQVKELFRFSIMKFLVMSLATMSCPLSHSHRAANWSIYRCTRNESAFTNGRTTITNEEQDECPRTSFDVPSICANSVYRSPSCPYSRIAISRGENLISWKTDCREVTCRWLWFCKVINYSGSQAYFNCYQNSVQIILQTTKHTNHKDLISFKLTS